MPLGWVGLPYKSATFFFIRLPLVFHKVQLYPILLSAFNYPKELSIDTPSIITKARTFGQILKNTRYIVIPNRCLLDGLRRIFLPTSQQKPDNQGGKI